MRSIFILLVAWLMVSLITGCELESEQINNSSELQLQFSTDSVVFDTVLTDRKSLSKRLRIVNPNNEAIRVSSIRLGNGDNSPFSMIVNGITSSQVNDMVIFGGDSVLVIINLNDSPGIATSPRIIRDSVLVAWNSREEHVKLLAWGVDSKKINTSVICDEIWDATQPYVISGFTVVDENCTLTIQAGAHIYLDPDASLVVKGSLKVMGDSANHVIFRNTRFDANYLAAPGQWGGLIFLASSQQNQISFAEIENGQIGIGLGYEIDTIDVDSLNSRLVLLPEQSPLTTSISIDHTSIRHMSVAGLLAFSSMVEMENSEIYNVGSYLLGNLAGGTYRYNHCTFSNRPSFFMTENPAVIVSDILAPNDTVVLIGDLQLEMTNCIIWGNNDVEFLIDNGGGAQLNVTLNHNIIRTQEAIPNNITSQEDNFPGFKEPFKFDYSLDSLSNAIDQGVPAVLTDITGRLRDSKPDIGAHEYHEKP